ncbi:single-stranded DNA-binding protein [Falcatimonas sp. MSJ-15]|jgi:single-strand DNA-binding protein|uniref:single-stranded DNA-binding protein n=1 Tax=Falcatimonas sp. MSJ-15 TaxID=2841515 RepID=UPI001C1204C9|nr:single-stranded DNA-binding protein [Falcatimonas sp. MSJ-15]MBU5469787.1 single-stranded DNA-binding protein [Falcatimonas sp. MSJ-15]
MNKIILKGRLTNNVNVKYAENDNHTALAMWNMAVDDRSWKEEGSYHTDYIPCFAAGKTAEIADANLCKGKEVLLYGKMQSGSYINRDGKKIYTLQMRVEEIEFCGKKSESRMPYEEEFMNMPDYPDDELPFR